MLETYSEASLDTCFFEGNEAINNGGAIFIKIRSKILLRSSTLKHNKAKNNGGAILRQHSTAIVKSCTFSNESVVHGYGGAISSENVANLTVQESCFDNCMASYGGSLSVRYESILKLEHSNFADSYAINEGGGLYIFQNSFVNGNNTTVTDGKSAFGGGFYVDESSDINLNIFSFLGNSVNESGGAIFCRKSQVTLGKGTLLHNYVKITNYIGFNEYRGEGGGIFGDNCHMVFDYIQIVNNTASHNGGGIYLAKSAAEIHNSEAVNNTARYNSNFGFVETNSMFNSNYLRLPEAPRNCIFISRSKAEMKHTYLQNWEAYCTFLKQFNSQILLDSVYYTDRTYTRRIQVVSQNNESIVCTHDISKAQRMVEG